MSHTNTAARLAATALVAAGLAAPASASAAVAADTATITLTGSGATVSGTGVSVSGSTVTITAGGTFQVSGTLTSGRLVVAAPEANPVTLVLNGASVTSADGAALGITSAASVTVRTAAGTTNRLVGGVKGNEDADAALYSTEDLVLEGSGTLSVDGRGEDGIASKDTLTVTSGTINVTAVDDGIRGKDSVTISGGTVSVTTTSGHGITSTNAAKADLGNVRITGGTVTVQAGNDGLHAEHAVSVSGSPVIKVTRSYEAIQGLTVAIGGGHLELTSTDDGVNAVEPGIDEFSASTAATITVTGGELVVDGGVDGLDSNGSITLSGGTVVASSAARQGGGEGGLDSNGPLNFRGGTVVGTGVTCMAVMSVPPTTGQGWVATKLKSSQPAGTVVHLVRDGAVLASYKSLRAFTEVVFSTAKITNGQSYQIYTGGTVTGTAVGGLTTTGGSLTGATQAGTATSGQYSGGLVGFPGGGGGWPRPGATPSPSPR